MVSWRSLAAALIGATALVAAAWAWAPPLYLTNDDVSMRLAVEGHAVPDQPPSGFVLMAHSALAWALVGLQWLMPNVVVWDLALAAAFVAGVAVLLAIGWDATGPRVLVRLAAVTGVLAACVPLVGGVQFTISATVAGGAAAVLIGLERESPQPRKAILAFGWLLLVAGSLVRPMGAAAGALTATVLLLPRALLRDRPRHVARAHGTMLAAIVVMAGLLISLDGLLYNKASSEWDAYHKFNWMAARLFEWGGEVPQRELDAVLASVGWSANDWKMLQTWWAVDPDVHGFPQVARAYEARTTTAGWDGWLRWVDSRLALVSWASARRLAAESAMPLAIVALLVIMLANLRTAAATFALVALFCGVCFAIEVMFKELPFRLLAPLQACLVIAALVTVASSGRRPRTAAAATALAVFVAVAVYQWQVVSAQARAERRHSDQVHREVAALLELHPSLVVFHADAFPAEHWWRPFEPTIRLPSFQLGMNNQNPPLQDYLRARGLQPLLPAICRDPSIFVVAEPGRLEFASQYMKEHFATSVQWRRAFAASFEAFRCEPRH